MPKTIKAAVNDIAILEDAFTGYTKLLNGGPIRQLSRWGCLFH